jgi:hypothetical protein
MVTFRVGDIESQQTTQSVPKQRFWYRNYGQAHSRSLAITLGTFIFTALGTTVVLKQMMTVKYEEDEEKSTMIKSQKNLSMLEKKHTEVDDSDLQKLENKLGWNTEFKNVNVPRPKDN